MGQQEAPELKSSLAHTCAIAKFLVQRKGACMGAVCFSARYFHPLFVVVWWF
jgi:hypothetical protein